MAICNFLWFDVYDKTFRLALCNLYRPASFKIRNLDRCKYSINFFNDTDIVYIISLSFIINNIILMKEIKIFMSFLNENNIKNKETKSDVTNLFMQTKNTLLDY